jgi:hypothetical protein
MKPKFIKDKEHKLGPSISRCFNYKKDYPSPREDLIYPCTGRFAKKASFSFPPVDESHQVDDKPVFKIRGKLHSQSEKVLPDLSAEQDYHPGSNIKNMTP